MPKSKLFCVSVFDFLLFVESEGPKGSVFVVKIRKEKSCDTVLGPHSDILTPP
jgi:hypothetical protein